ncbi:MAG: aminoacyl-tRNA hydrolase [bacterium]|nr:aminoacyl-tRNA hydrolase [bacterium]MDE0439222.1 aminoacyl-tRNA hydrolase [bacterium]
MDPATGDRHNIRHVKFRKAARGGVSRHELKVIVGLHNPEPRYAGTRHNVGAEVVRALVEGQRVGFRRGPRGMKGETARLSIEERPAVLALPLLSMNVCGSAVRAVLSYYKVRPSQLLVVHDDIDLPFGRLRLHEGRGHGGHNGVRSVISDLGTRDFWRLKVGLGRPPGRMDPAAFVLGRFTREERTEVDHLIADAAGVVRTFMSDADRAVAQAAGRRPRAG